MKISHTIYKFKFLNIEVFFLYIIDQENYKINILKQKYLIFFIIFFLI